MAKIDIYTSATCGYCMMAKRILKRKEAAFDEIPVDGDDAMRAAMIQRANGGRTVPQIFIGDVHIGGFDDLNALEQAGKLDALLSA